MQMRDLGGASPSDLHQGSACAEGDQGRLREKRPPFGLPNFQVRGSSGGLELIFLVSVIVRPRREL